MGVIVVLVMRALLRCCESMLWARSKADKACMI